MESFGADTAPWAMVHITKFPVGAIDGQRERTDANAPAASGQTLTSLNYTEPTQLTGARIALEARAGAH